MHALDLLRAAALGGALTVAGAARAADDTSLWAVYDQSLKPAKYIDLTHAFEPVQPVWPGFANAGSSRASPART